MTAKGVAKSCLRGYNRRGVSLIGMNVRKFILALSVLVVAACSQSQEGATVVRTSGDMVPSEKVSGTSGKKATKRTKVRRSSRVQKSQVTDMSAGAATPVEMQEPADTKPFVAKKPGHRVSQVNVPGKYVAITFDDGPSSAYTPQVLDILKRHGARATFFVLGENAARHKGLLARAVAEGHEIANHTYSHIKMTSAGSQKVAREIERTGAIIKDATGFFPTTMRPPYGATNAKLVDMMYNDYGMYSVLWDVDTKDWQHPGINTVVNRAVNKAKPGSIILLHDIHASTLAAVEGVVTGLQARGFKLVTVSQLIEMGRRAAGGTMDSPTPQPAEEPATGSTLPVAELLQPASENPTGAAEISGGSTGAMNDLNLLQL